ncbi:hypothetical protein BC830DRAFT_1165791 [Chytriomyces sp. MP71]|nr:hypothetical protein BC830DRAFT_1165791 [Chytriomyces sp. MP71]
MNSACRTYSPTHGDDSGWTLIQSGRRFRGQAPLGKRASGGYGHSASNGSLGSSDSASSGSGSLSGNGPAAANSGSGGGSNAKSRNRKKKAATSLSQSGVSFDASSASHAAVFLPHDTLDSKKLYSAALNGLELERPQQEDAWPTFHASQHGIPSAVHVQTKSFSPIGSGGLVNATGGASGTVAAVTGSPLALATPPGLFMERHVTSSPSSRMSIGVTNSFIVDMLGRCLQEAVFECRYGSNPDLVNRVRLMLQDALYKLDAEVSATPHHFRSPSNAQACNPFSSTDYVHNGSSATSSFENILLPSFLHINSSIFHPNPLSRMSSNMTMESEPFYEEPLPQNSRSNCSNGGLKSDLGDNSSAPKSNLPVWDRSVPLSSRLNLKGDILVRLMSPPIRKPSTLDELELKQVKAQSLRESFLQDRTIKLKQKAEKAKAEKVIDIPAQIPTHFISQKRDKIIRSIQGKAKEEGLKKDDIAVMSALNIESRKVEVTQRHLDSEARLHEMEEERLRKLADMAALQEAVMERRRVQEAERQAKINRDEERKKEIEAKRDVERKESLASKEAAKLAKVKRAEELKSFKEAQMEDMKRELSDKFQLKLEKWTTRYNEFLQKKKDKAAIANMNARAVAENAKKSQGISSSESFCNLQMAATGDDVKPFDREKGLKRRVKKLKKRLRDASSNYTFIPSSACLPQPTKSMQVAYNQLSALVRSNTVTSDKDALITVLSDLLQALNSEDGLMAESFCNMNGLAVLFNSLMLLDEEGNLTLPVDTLGLALSSIMIACRSSVDGSLSALTIGSFQRADLASIITMLVSLVLINGSMSRMAALEHPVSNEIALFTLTGLRLMNSLCHLNLTMNLLSEEGIQAQFLHLSLFWLSYYSEWISGGEESTCSLLIQELVVLLGHACFQNTSNQALLRFGNAGLILLKLIIALPFEFFCDARLKRVLFPALLSACAGNHSNLVVVQEDLNLNILLEWAQEEEEKGLGCARYCFSRQQLQETATLLASAL